MASLSDLVRRRAKRGQSVREIAAALGMRPVDVRRALDRRDRLGRPELPPGKRKVQVSISRETAEKLGLLSKSSGQ